MDTNIDISNDFTNWLKNHKDKYSLEVLSLIEKRNLHTRLSAVLEEKDINKKLKI